MRAAAARGQSSMLRPFLFEAPSGDWAGDHVEESEQRAEVFFERYGSLLVHAACVAELGGAELLCVGTELPQATRTDPTGDEWIPDFTHLSPERWRAMIRRARGAFGGALTYAAEARGEAAQVTFWDALDRPGLEIYNPLSVPAVDGAAAPERGVMVGYLRQTLQWAQALGEQCGAPCLIVEIGFPASALAWQYPAETRGAPDPQEQARLLAALVQAFEIEKPKLTRVGGLYLWNWSTDPAAGRAEDESYTPQGRPGEHFVRRLFAGR
jgi:hypothetical protein